LVTLPWVPQRGLDIQLSRPTGSLSSDDVTSNRTIAELLGQFVPDISRATICMPRVDIRNGADQGNGKADKNSKGRHDKPGKDKPDKGK
jgi:hypothetical protein